MMSPLPSSIQRAIDEFTKLPGIGPKSAARLVFYLISKHPDDVSEFGDAIKTITEGISPCTECFNWSETPVCDICSSQERNPALLMVVGDSLDIVALEKTGYKGRYFVLGGVISPMHGIGPEELRVRALLDKLKREQSTLEEVILALDPSLEGDATAMYLAQELKGLPLNLTRIARGLPIGSDVEYADQFTLQRSLDGRQKV